MKFILLMLTTLLFCGFTHAQDLITLRNGTQYNCKVTEVGIYEVAYKINDTTYTVPKRKVLIINFENGTKEVLYTAPRPKEHFLYAGLNENYLSVINNYTNYYPFMASGYTEVITNMKFVFPGFQVNYISYHGHSPTVSFYNGEGLIYYHNKFNDNVSNVYPFYTPYPSSESSNTITYVNSRALFIHYILGLRFSLPSNLYINVAVEPHLTIYYNSIQPQKVVVNSFDSLGQMVGSTTYNGEASINPISAFNVNATFGIGYRLFASKPHPLNIEFDLSPDIFNSDYFFLNDNDEDDNSTTFHRYTFELSAGYKF